MTENRHFKFALIVSLLAHSVFFTSIPHIYFPSKKPEPDRIKVSYYKIKEKPKEKENQRPRRPRPLVKKLPEIKKEEILNKDITPQQKKHKEPVKRTGVAGEASKEKSFARMIKEERDESKKATYISYYRAIREKIRLHADKNYPHNKRTAQGEVFLSFIVASNGQLLQVMVVDEKSSADRTLRNMAIHSIRDASPFPSFPEGMDQYQITFNVIISFEPR